MNLTVVIICNNCVKNTAPGATANCCSQQGDALSEGISKELLVPICLTSIFGLRQHVLVLFTTN